MEGVTKFKFGDRCQVISSEYCCAPLGTVGTIVRLGDSRHLVRWDSNPSMLFGVHVCDIKRSSHD